MGRLRGCMWLGAGLVVAVVAGIVAFVALERATTLRSTEELAVPRIEVVVAARAVEVRSQLVAQDLELRELPVDTVPEGALRQLAEGSGKITLVDLHPGEVVLAQRLVDPNVVTGDGRHAVVIAEDQVLMAFPAEDLMSTVGVLKPGDHVDLLFSLDFPASRGLAGLPEEGGPTGVGIALARSEEDEQATFILLQDVTVAAIIAGRTSTTARQSPIGVGQARTGDEEEEKDEADRRQTTAVTAAPPEAILFTLNPQDALLLKYANDAGGIVDIVLRAPGMERPFDTEPVDVDYMIHRYRIPTGVGR